MAEHRFDVREKSYFDIVDTQNEDQVVVRHDDPAVAEEHRKALELDPLAPAPGALTPREEALRELEASQDVTAVKTVLAKLADAGDATAKQALEKLR